MAEGGLTLTAEDIKNLDDTLIHAAQTMTLFRARLENTLLEKDVDEVLAEIDDTVKNHASNLKTALLELQSTLGRLRLCEQRPGCDVVKRKERGRQDRDSGICSAGNTPVSTASQEPLSTHIDSLNKESMFSSSASEQAAQRGPVEQETDEERENKTDNPVEHTGMTVPFQKPELEIDVSEGSLETTADSWEVTENRSESQC